MSLHGTLRWLLLALALLVAAGAWVFRPARLEVPAMADLPLPAASVPAQLRIEPLRTGEILTRAMLAFRGGAFGEPRRLVVGGVLVHHPRGTLLVDAGFGADLERQLRSLPAPMRHFTDARLDQPMGAALAARGLEPAGLAAVVLTHAHWDHVSGLGDLAGVTVRLAEPELEFIRSGHGATRLARRITGVRFEPLSFEDGAYLGFAQSHDLFGDGSVVLVPAGGHTPGSLIVFVALPSGYRIALIGDQAWQAEGVDRPAERPLPMRLMVDTDAARVRDNLRHLHVLQQQHPELLVVPAHDLDGWRRLEALAR